MITETLDPDAAVEFAWSLADVCGRRAQLEVLREGREDLRVCGPDGFGFLGGLAWRPIVVHAPLTREKIALAVARHVLADLDATDEAVRARTHELPLGLAVVLTAG